MHTDPKQNEDMKRELGLLDATMLVAGSMIGSGIFIVSSDIVRNVGSAGWLIFIWLVTGLITIIAATSYGELSAMFPKAGGQYVYLREAYNRMVAFLYGWSLFMVIQAGTIAAVGVAFAKFTAYIFPTLGDDHILWDLGLVEINAAQLVAIVTIVILTWVNSRGVKNGKIIQTVFTVVKILSLGGLIVMGLFGAFNAEIWSANWSTAWDTVRWDTSGVVVSIGGAAVFAGIVSAMVGSIFSSDAWNNVTFIAGEIRNPKRNIGMSLFLGTLIVTIIYVSANLMYLATLSMEQIAHAPADRVAVAAAQAIFGQVGTLVIAVMIMISTFGCNNGLILAGARVYYTMAQDGLFFKKAGELNKFEVPGWGLWAQCIWTSVLCLTGRYGDLLNYVVFVVLIFYALTIIGVFTLRRKRPDIERPYKAFGYPVLPIVYVLAAFTICIGLLIYQPTFTWPGLVIVLLGIPVFFMWNKRYETA
ncbi:amino acid/polyamine/organocation transporter, APC superfamily [Parapedobacter indicus]|uniref:Amino acid/polyamine/organocation transporter, APC superfamily n=2 Tax=Parapedobacter indicus TaxID=1477437 RepID=A0A1I3R9T8_9SPHI|nr:amino acid/polyamine/organocation transporter (APC superfamily) [Parapedobacter indicus]SFJ41956.1 amino acid/polyamine/organocation transporter, APC superfamily [Parapedobacter indicus]